MFKLKMNAMNALEFHVARKNGILAKKSKGNPTMIVQLSYSDCLVFVAM